METVSFLMGGWFFKKNEQLSTTGVNDTFQFTKYISKYEQRPDTWE